MKLLFYQNLSHGLPALLADLFPDSAHVRAATLDQAPDDQIWECASANDFCTVTEDNEFTERHRESCGRKTNMNTTATLKIFLVHGDPASLRTAEISNWTGKAVAGPRSQLDAVLQREESNKPGVYFLTGINPETGKERVYIGEAEVIRSRVKGHLDR